MATPALPSVRAQLELTNRKYIVTGGAQGIGYAAARAIAEMGGDVAVLDIQQSPKEDVAGLATTFGRRAFYFQADVSDETALRRAFAQALAQLGGLDGVFTAAGIAIDKAFTEQSWQEAERIYRINTMGTFFTAQLAAQHFEQLQKPGSIVLVSSICAHVGLPGYRMAAYNASKGGVQMLAKALANELAPKGIRVNTVAPAFTETEMTKNARDANPRAAGLMYSSPPLGRIGTPADVAGAVVYLLSDAAAYTTGTEVMVTGGIHLGRHSDYEGY